MSRRLRASRPTPKSDRNADRSSRVAPLVKDGPQLIPDWDTTSDPSVRGAAFQGPRGKLSVHQLRRWSRTNPWIRAAINLRKRQLSAARWDIAPFTELYPDYVVPPATVQKIKELLVKPNPKGESWRSLIEAVCEDVLVLDQGCIELEATVAGRLGITGLPPIAYLWGVDGGAIRVDPNWDGTEPDKPRYFQFDEAGRQIAAFLNTELTFIMETPTTYGPLGLGSCEVLADTIEADMLAAEYNRKMVHSATPPGLIDLGEGIRPDQVDAFRAYWDAEIAGKSQVAITGGGKNMKWTPLNANQKDSQFLEWCVYMARKICAVFACQPQDIGISFDVNKSTAEAGQSFTEDKGLTPFLELFAAYITREIVWRFDPQARFVFVDLGRQNQADAANYYAKAMPGIGWVRPNEALSERGSDPLPDDQFGDEIWVNVPNSGPVPMSLWIAQQVAATGLAVNPPPPPPVIAPPAGPGGTEPGAEAKPEGDANGAAEPASGSDGAGADQGSEGQPVKGRPLARRWPSVMDWYAARP